jgi:putative membrane-bound dehydrogenase-like protein
VGVIGALGKFPIQFESTEIPGIRILMANRILERYAAAIIGATLLTGGIWLYLHRARAERAGLSALSVPSGFKVERAAGPDLVSYPMMATFDDRGRLFICESSGNTLNNAQMAANPDYKIRMLEDSDGDGVFDRGKVFADRLTLPAGAVWYRNSLYVASPPDLLRFADTNGDGVADSREVVVTGWKMSANAASLHGPIFGPDGWLYLTDGRHGFDIKTKDGREYKGLGSRIWRVRPDGTGLEWLAGGGFDNPVEVEFTPSGETIGTMTYFKDPENGERDALLHFVEGGVYPKPYSQVMGEFKRSGELMPVMTKFARIAPSGLARYRSDIFGAEYRSNLFSAQFNPHRVQRHVLHREGATFRTDDSDFLTSTDPDFHPTDVLEDADGSLLVLDTGAWFIHGCPISRVAKPEIKGSIYRIRKSDAPLVRDARGSKLDLKAASLADVAKLVQEARPAVRDRAIEFLVEAGAPAVAALTSLRDSSRNDEARSAAVFALYRINTPEARTAVRAALTDADFKVRIAAARCAGMAHDREAVPRLMEIAKADHPASRRQAIAALGQIGDASAMPALIAAASNPEDRFVEHSTIFSLITLNQPAALQKQLSSDSSKVRKAALIAMDQLDSSPLRREHMPPLLRTADKELRSAALWVASRHTDWAEVVLADLGERLRNPDSSAQELESVRDALIAFSENAPAQAFVASVLRDRTVGERQLLFTLDTIEGIRLKQLPAAWTAALSKLLDGPRPNVRTRVVELIRSRGLTGFNEQLQAIASDTNTPDQLRATALDVLVTRRSKLTSAQYTFLTSRLSPQSDAVLRQTAARIIGRSAPDLQQLIQIASEHLPKADPLTFSTVLDCFRNSKDEKAGLALIEVLRKTRSVLGTLGEERLKTLLAGYGPNVQQSSKPLFEQLQRAQKERIARLEKLEPLLTAGGDVGRGRRLFFGEKVACASCHTIGLEGRKVGPDLTGIGAIRSGHDLLEAIVFPSASFVPGHEVFNVDTETERLSGVIKSQSKEAVVLITGPDGEVRIPRSTVKSVTPSTVSLMPEGFDEQMSKTELTDLLAFLQAEKTRPRTMASSSTGL